jgi:hypothetical protein
LKKTQLRKPRAIQSVTVAIDEDRVARTVERLVWSDEEGKLVPAPPPVTRKTNWKKEKRAYTSALAKNIDLHRCMWDSKEKVWRAWEGERLVAKWREEALPGLGDWIAHELVMSLAVLQTERGNQSEAGSRGGRKTVHTLRRKADSKSDRLRKYLVNNPDAETTEVADRFGCDPSLVNRIRRSLK